MPHVIVKFWPGKAETQKQQLADAITQSVKNILQYGDDAVSVAMEEVAPGEWTEKVYQPDIMGRSGKLYKTPSYGPLKGA